VNSVPLVIALAIGWHAAMFWIGRSRRKEAKPSLAQLLHNVEIDLLSTLRGELARLLLARPELNSRYGRRLKEITDRLHAGDRDAR